MRVMKKRLIECSEYNSLIFNHCNYSNTIAREKLTSNVAIQAFGIELTRDSANGRFRLLERIQVSRLG